MQLTRDEIKARVAEYTAAFDNHLNIPVRLRFASYDFPARITRVYKPTQEDLKARNCLPDKLEKDGGGNYVPPVLTVEMRNAEDDSIITTNFVIEDITDVKSGVERVCIISGGKEYGFYYDNAAGPTTANDSAATG